MNIELFYTHNIPCTCILHYKIYKKDIWKEEVYTFITVVGMVLILYCVCSWHCIYIINMDVNLFAYSKYILHEKR